jgi:triacylglycerol lipase
MEAARYLTIFTAVLAACLSGCGKDPAPMSRTADCVVLLHGLARSSLSMERMKIMLEEHGYHVANIDYPSRDHKIEVLAPLAVEAGLSECSEKSDYTRVHFVTHSLGGILVRAYFAQHHIDELGRVVMLGPPNQGSKAVDQMEQIPGFDWLNGPAGYQLGKGSESIPLALGPPDFEFAVIAGDRTIDPITSAILDDPDDGKVSVSDTKLSGMSDFAVLPVSHTMIMQDGEVFELVRNFLAHGSFDPARTN